MRPERLITLTIHVKPGSTRASVGGRHGDALVVAVTSRAVDGRATEAALAAIADALGLRRRDVSLRHGTRSRSKVVELDVAEADTARVAAAVRDLLER